MPFRWLMNQYIHRIWFSYQLQLCTCMENPCEFWPFSSFDWEISNQPWEISRFWGTGTSRFKLLEYWLSAFRQPSSTCRTMLLAQHYGSRAFSVFKSGVLWQFHREVLLFLRYTNFFLAQCRVKKVKVAHSRLPSVGFRSWSRFLAVSLQVMWIIKPTVGCHYFLPGPQLPTQPLIQFCCLVNRGTVGVNSLPKTAAWQRRGFDLNPGSSVPESSTLTTRLPSHPYGVG